MLAFEIVYIYVLQFPEAGWTKLPLNVAHKETGDFTEKSLRKFTGQWNTTRGLLDQTKKSYLGKAG